MTTFTLDLPTVETARTEILEQTKLPEETGKTVLSTADQKANDLLAMDLTNFEERHQLAKTFEDFGADLMQKTQTKNGILNKRVGDLQKSSTEGSVVANSLADLSIKIKDLDPSALDFTKTGTLGNLFNPICRYFHKYKTADAEIAEIVKSLDKGQKILKQDNVTLELEKENLFQLIQELNQRIVMGVELDTALSNQIANIRQTAPDSATEDKLKFLEEEVLFPLRQRIMDFESMLATSQQGCIAMDILRRNNLELIRGVDRAKTVTITALRTAVTIAGALYNQKIVLDKLTLVNETTSQMISSTASMLKNQGTAIQKKAMESTINPEDLKKAYADTFAALDELSEYRQKALPVMQNTINQFRELSEESQKRLDRIKQRDSLTN